MWPNPQFPVDFVTFTEEILNGKLQLLCSEVCLVPCQKGALFPKLLTAESSQLFSQKKNSILDFWPGSEYASSHGVSEESTYLKLPDRQLLPVLQKFQVNLLVFNFLGIRNCNKKHTEQLTQMTCEKWT